MIVLETERLTLRWLDPGDAPFMVELLNEPDFLEFIGDRGVRTLDDARAYIRNGPMASYEANGHGIMMTALRQDGTPIGTCGLLRRDNLEHPDVGFAFLARYQRKGYAYEAAAAAMEHGREVLGLDPIVAITSLHNPASIALLEKLGLRFDKIIPFGEDGDQCRLFTTAEAD